MSEMTGRQRVLTSLAHREPDRVPVDFGSTWVSSITVTAYERLKRHLGIDSRTVIMEPMQQVCMVDERILDLCHADTRGVFYGPPELERNRWIPQRDGTFCDGWGLTWQKPPSSHYYDMVVPPLCGPITLSDVASHTYPEPRDPGYVRGLRERVQDMRRRSDRALVLNLGAWVIQNTQFIRGFHDWFIDTVAGPKIMEALCDAVTEVVVATNEYVLAEVHDLIDVVSVSDDIGHQDRTCVAPEVYRRIFKPWHRRVLDGIRKWTGAPIMFHTCGSVYDVLPDLIEIGVDCLNPVQDDAKDMDAARLKREYGDRLTFWGGINARHVLPFGTPEEVWNEVRRKVLALGAGGGYILSAVHNIQPCVPVGNFMAMVEAAQELGRYPLDADGSSAKEYAPGSSGYAGVGEGKD